MTFIPDRILAQHIGDNTGPLFICIGGIHGNEHAGVKAIREVARLLAIEPEHNPGFIYHGTFLGLAGNVAAGNTNKRFISRDMNRLLSDFEIESFRNHEFEDLLSEEKEALQLVDLINGEIKAINPPFTLILDLHTTTADGGLFTICADDHKSLELAKGLHAPVILGIGENLPGTSLMFWNRPDEKSHCIVFEAGQHDDPSCVHRMVAAIVNCMRSIGAVHPKDVDHRHDGLLIELSKDLPKVTRLVYHYLIQPGEEFVMKEGYSNFQQIVEGECVATNIDGEINSPIRALMLMPKYQPLGDDGFFLIEPIE